MLQIIYFNNDNVEDLGERHGTNNIDALLE